MASRCYGMRLNFSQSQANQSCSGKAALPCAARHIYYQLQGRLGRADTNALHLHSCKYARGVVSENHMACQCKYSR